MKSLIAALAAVAALAVVSVTSTYSVDSHAQDAPRAERGHNVKSPPMTKPAPNARGEAPAPQPPNSFGFPVEADAFVAYLQTATLTPLQCHVLLQMIPTYAVANGQAPTAKGYEVLMQMITTAGAQKCQPLGTAAFNQPK